ncbi:DUF5675 family protein [Pseudodesulfovibrio sediminis]|uniref:DUF5675 domain-containing protein n=1 Tax=Pseudodesulfovibrio sediminis TaxID=2810563 RepID=A0ABM7P3K9_9BACT|nr:DUF5675 family protein [Pseudodesulfovibrio sediminis]BCS87347.1 hypothetical protein PSDVSF_05890 [Pseudodesulfovibrio sediminis]
MYATDPLKLYQLGAPLHELLAAEKHWRALMQVRLIRYDEDQDGTFGVLLVDGRPFCSVLEPMDKGNAVNISCIPAGEYVCGIVDSPRFGRTFEVKDVPGRSHILFHAGNVVEDTHGCLLLGEYEGKLHGDRAVLNSGNTFRRFLAACVGLTEYRLEILEAV